MFVLFSPLRGGSIICAPQHKYHSDVQKYDLYQDEHHNYLLTRSMVGYEVTRRFLFLFHRFIFLSQRKKKRLF
jgi:hypothetical protein